MGVTNSIVKIQVKPHVKKVMVKLWGPEPIKLEKRNLAGAHLSHLDLHGVPEFNSGKSTVELKILLTKAMQDRYRILEWKVSLGNYFQKIFHLMLCVHIHAQRACGHEIFQSIDLFYAIYGITVEDYDQESAYRQYKRWKQPLNDSK